MKREMKCVQQKWKRDDYMYLRVIHVLRMLWKVVCVFDPF